MVEYNPYLSSILGDGAVQINILNGNNKLYGELNQKQVHPLQEVRRSNDGMVCLKVNESHLSGHFSGPKTFPAYRMLELSAMVGDRVRSVERASFSRIVTPGDTLKAFIQQNKKVQLVRNKEYMQEVAQASMIFDEKGLLPHELGSVLEVAAQTTVANMANSNPHIDQSLYPIVLGVQNIQVSNSELTTYLNARPTNMEQIDDNMFKASAEVKSDSDVLIATVDDMIFKFADERRIHIYDTLGRTQ